MVDGLSNYALSIACTAFILNLIQMILPNGKNKKYILFVCSMMTTIILIKPIIELINDEIDVSTILYENQKEYINIEKEAYINKSEEKIIKEYKRNIEMGIISRLENIGYRVRKIDCTYNNLTLEPEYLYLEIEHQDREIQPVKIEVANNNMVDKEELMISELIEIKKILREEYGINDVEVVKWKKY